MGRRRLMGPHVLHTGHLALVDLPPEGLPHAFEATVRRHFGELLGRGQAVGAEMCLLAHLEVRRGGGERKPLRSRGRWGEVRGGRARVRNARRADEVATELQGRERNNASAEPSV